MKWPTSVLCDSTLVSMGVLIITSVAVWAHLMFCCGAVLSILCTIITSRTTVCLPFTTFHEFYHTEHFCPVWNKKNKQKKQYVRRADKPINASQEEFLRSPAAPVDVFHQDCHAINNPHLSAQGDRWLHMLTVCVLSARASSTKQHLLSTTTNKDFRAVWRHPL